MGRSLKEGNGNTLQYSFGASLVAHTVKNLPAMWQCAVVSRSVRLLATPWDCSPPGSSVHGILQARILECRSFTRPENGHSAHNKNAMQGAVSSLHSQPPTPTQLFRGPTLPSRKQKCMVSRGCSVLYGPHCRWLWGCSCHLLAIPSQEQRLGFCAGSPAELLRLVSGQRSG